MALSGGSKVFLALLVVAVGLFFGGLFAINDSDKAGDGESQPVTVQIPEGTGAAEVADILAEQDVLSSPTVFKFLARFDDRSAQIKPGTYELRTGMGTDEVLQILSEGPPLPDSFRVVIPEGLTVKQALGRIADAEGSPFKLRQLRKALVGVPLPEWVPSGDLPEGAQFYEGLLFPATYEFFVDISAQELLRQMVAETDALITGVQPPDGTTRYEMLTIASMIEREAKLPREQPVISSVIYNRLAAPMRLQIDATVQYAQGEQSERLLFSDLEIDSAWNTYEVDGLPPTPIAAPGRGAIEAAANPANTDFHFYVVCDPETGEHAFATSNQQHNANRAQFDRVREEGGSYCDAAAG